MKDFGAAEIIQRIRVENPWWKGKAHFPPLYSDVDPRPYIELFFPHLKNRDLRRAIVLMGPRRVGKTYLIHHSIHRLIKQNHALKRILYVSIDNPIYNGLSLEQILYRYQEATGVDITSEECTVFFDEIQYLKDWERHLKSLVDTYPKLKLCVSGSAAAALKLKSTESGAGRFTDFSLPPLLFYEYLKIKHGNVDEGMPIEELNEEFIDYVNFGGYPEVIHNVTIRDNPGQYIKQDIIDKVLLRDLPSLYGISDIQELNNLFTVLAYNTGQEVSYENLSKRSGIAKNTLKKYIEYLEAAFLVKRVRRVDQNGRRMKRDTAFKVYLNNPSMYAALFSPVHEDNPEWGHLVETAFFGELFHLEIDPQLSNSYYAKWVKGTKTYEIDCIMVNKESPSMAFEVKWSNKIVDDYRYRERFIGYCKDANIQTGFITTKSKFDEFATDQINIKYIPISVFCERSGHNILKAKLETYSEQLSFSLK